MPTGKTPEAIAMNFFQALSFYYTYVVFEGHSSGYKINEMVNDHLNSCKQQQFYKIYANIAKDDLQYLVTPTGYITDATALKW